MRVGFPGKRKFGKYLGSYACPNENCYKLTSEGLVNKSDFQMKNKMAICKSCVYYAKGIYCGCYKVTEFDLYQDKLIVYHKGSHICNVKFDASTRKQFIEEHLNFATHQKPEELQFDIMSYYLSQGDMEKALKAARMLNDRKMVEQL